MSDSDVILRNFAKKITSKFPLKAETANNLSALTLKALIIEIIKLLLKFHPFQNKAKSLKSYSNPNMIQRTILRRCIKKVVSRKELDGVNENEVVLAIRLGLNDTSVEEMELVVEACNAV